MDFQKSQRASRPGTETGHQLGRGKIRLASRRKRRDGPQLDLPGDITPWSLGEGKVNDHLCVMVGVIGLANVGNHKKRIKKNMGVGLI